jgi:hypothetical protein
MDLLNIAGLHMLARILGMMGHTMGHKNIADLCKPVDILDIVGHRVGL